MAFSQIKGHKEQIDYLVSAFSNNRLAQAYLFVGREGIGKKLVAKNFAKLLNCKEVNTKNSILTLKGEGSLDCCDRCISCSKIERSLHPDVFYLKPDAGSIKIESIRDLKWFFSLFPYEADYKIAIIDDAQALTIEAANSLLKLLEEPNRTAILILISQSTDKLLPTIVSRCQIVRFKTLSEDLLSSILYSDYHCDKKDAKVFAGYSGGSIGGALRLMEEDFLSLRNRIISSFPSRRVDIIKKELFNAPDNYKLKEIVFILLILFRDILMLKNRLSEEYLINIDFDRDIGRISEGLDINEVLLILNKLLELYRLIDENINKRLIVEALISYISYKKNLKLY